MNCNLILMDDYQALYIDGVLVSSGDCINLKDVFEHLGFNFSLTNLMQNRQIRELLPSDFRTLTGDEACQILESFGYITGKNATGDYFYCKDSDESLYATEGEVRSLAIKLITKC